MQAVETACRWRLPAIAITIMVICGPGSSANAAEVAPFRTTDIDSHIELRYRSYERIRSIAGIESYHEQRIDFEEEFSIATKNYVFHPNFLKLDLGAGLTFNQNSFETGGATNKEDDNWYSLNARASFLEKKLYPMAFYYARTNPTFFVGLSEPVQQKDTRFGFDMALLQPLIPLRLELTASHDEQSGGSPTQLIDDSSDKIGIRASKVYSRNYSHRLRFDHGEESSGSGSLTLPITPTSSTTDQLSYSSEWHPGGQDNISYSDIATVIKQDGVSSSDSVDFAPRLIWQHSDRARSSYSYMYSDRSQDGLDTTNHSAKTDFTYQYNEQTLLKAEAIMEDFASNAVDQRSIGANARIDYQQPIAKGRLRLIGGLDYRENVRDVTATSGLASVIDEIITLSGLTPVALANEFIDIGPPTSIVVQNLARSQTYVENTDYRIIVIGSRSEIQRLAGSNIGDPQQVVVDYDYQTGVSADYSSLEWFYDVGVTFDRFDLYLRHRLNDINVSGGGPTLPLYSRDTLEFGGGTEYPLNNRTTVGASVDMVREREDNNPYDSQRYNAFGQFIVGNQSTLRLNADWSTLDNIGSVEDSDLTQFGIIFRSRLRNRMTISVEAYSEKDTGGTLIRKKDDLKFAAHWNVYALTMKAEALFSTDQTGTVESERTRFMLTVRRDI